MTNVKRTIDYGTCTYCGEPVREVVEVGAFGSIKTHTTSHGTAPGLVDSLPVRIRPRWKDQGYAQGVSYRVPS